LSVMRMPSLKPAMPILFRRTCSMNLQPSEKLRLLTYLARSSKIPPGKNSLNKSIINTEEKGKWLKEC
jgi:hypothetical protein